MSLCFLFHRVLVVANIFTCSSPALAQLARIDIRVHKRPHPVIVERVGLQQIYDIETVGASSHCITNPEVVPLSKAPCVVVRLQDQIIFKLIYLNSSA